MGEVVCDDDLISTTIVGKRGAPKMTLIGKLKNNSTKKAILTQKKMFLKEKIYVKENLTPYKYRAACSKRQKTSQTKKGSLIRF